jgi:glucokinase
MQHPVSQRRLLMGDSRKKPTYLAADIGGTKTNVGLFIPGKKKPRLQEVETYASRDARNFETILERFVKKHASSVASACFGIAGPVVNGRSKATNFPWVVSENGIRDHFQWNHVRLVNDLEATASSIPVLDRKQICRLNRVRARKDGNIGIVAPGTGFGEALLVRQGGDFRVVPSEGGHVDFAPNTEEEVSLWRYLREQWGHVSVERVLSGPGLLSIYQWLKDSGRYQEPAWLVERMGITDPAPVIAKTALESGLPLCRQAMVHFVSILGAVSANLALTAMTFGGIYVGGGIPPKILPFLREDIFLQAFTDKGRFKGFMEKIPVMVILDSRAALVGAAIIAEKMTAGNRAAPGEDE